MLRALRTLVGADKGLQGTTAAIVAAELREAPAVVVAKVEMPGEMAVGSVVTVVMGEVPVGWVSGRSALALRPG